MYPRTHIGPVAEPRIVFRVEMGCCTCRGAGLKAESRRKAGKVPSGIWLAPGAETALGINLSYPEDDPIHSSSLRNTKCFSPIQHSPGPLSLHALHTFSCPPTIPASLATVFGWRGGIQGGLW